MHNTPSPSNPTVPDSHADLLVREKVLSGELKALDKIYRDSLEREGVYSLKISSLQVQIANYQTREQLMDELAYFTSERTKVAEENEMMGERVEQIRKELNDLQTRIHNAIRASRKVESDNPDNAGLPNLTNP